jgi:hypothetical protein
MADITQAQMDILEKLISDEEFRASFFDDPDATIAKAGIEISEEEMARVKAVDFASMQSAFADLELRLSKSSASAAFDAGSAVEDLFASFFKAT